jgi:hypothetical protein
MPKDPMNKKPSIISWIYVVIAVLVILLLALVVWFSADVVSLKKQGVFTPVATRIHRPFLSKPTIAASQIQNWMTFGYIEHVYKIPESYLQTQLNSTSALQTNNTLNTYAASSNLDSAAFVEKIRSIVAAYQAGGNP